MQNPGIIENINWRAFVTRAHNFVQSTIYSLLHVFMSLG